MVSATKLCLFTSKVIIGVLGIGAWMMAVAGLGKLHDVCKDHLTSSICESELRSQWWTMVLQALVMGVVGILSFKSWMKRWRFPLVGLLAIVSMRLMADIQIGLSAQLDKTRLNQLDKELHSSIVEIFNRDLYYSDYNGDWDDVPERERLLWEAITQGHKLLAQSAMASLHTYGDLKTFPFGIYEGGLIILTMINLLLVMGIGTDENLKDYEPYIAKWVEAGSSENVPRRDRKSAQPSGNSGDPNVGSTSQAPAML